MTIIRKSALTLSLIFFAATSNAQDVNFLLTNQSGSTLMEFYASPENVSAWEEDILGNDVLESGYVSNIVIADNRSQCIYDMRMVFDDGDELLDTVNICEMGGYTINAATSNAQDVNFLLTNHSDYTLVEFYASPENVSAWEEDILGNGVLESGYVLNIVIADNRSQCIYDMRMVFNDGGELLDTVNICEMGGYTINP